MQKDLAAFAQRWVGTMLCGRYRIGELLGVGGMGAVYAGTHRNGHPVAIKILHERLLHDPEAERLFRREAELTNTVNHPGVLPIIDDDVTEDGRLFLVMPLLEGETLRARWERHDKQLQVEEVIAIAHALLEILGAAHAVKIVHRDIKPENVFITRDEGLRILDFGVARLFQNDDQLSATRSGRAVGTPAFMAPEQALGRSRAVDGRTDLWAVGAAMFSLLTGRFVHQAETSGETLVHAATRVAPRLAGVTSRVPAPLCAVVDRALEFDKEARWPDAATMDSALVEAFRAAFGRPVPPVPKATPRPASEPGGLHSLTTRPPHVAPGAPLLRQEVFLAAPLAETAMHTKLFGRSEQLDALRAALDAVASGRGRVALVTGEPGIGKSALAGAVVDVAVARGMRTGWGTSDEARAAPALWPLTVAFGDLVAGLDEQVHSHLRARGESIAGLLPQFDDPLAEPRVFDADTATFRLARALAGLLGQIVGPAAIVLDDVQWADEPTLRTVRALLPLIARVPVLFVVTARDTEAQVSPLLDMVLEELSRSARPRLRLPGLGTDDIARFVGAGSIEASTVAALQVQTGGNPFYLGELMAMLAAEQTVPDAETIGALDVPDGVCDIVRRRLVRLPEQVGSYLATAATAGHHFAYDVIAAASGLSADEAATALATARRTGFVVDEGAGGGRFQHGLVRTAIADRVPVTRRRSMHAAIAEALQQVTRSAADAAQIAAHYLAAGPEFAARATMFARAAADAAEKRGALGEAWRNYDVARAAAGTDADHSLLVALARAQKRMGYVREAWATARDAAQAALDAGDVVGAGEAVVTMSADTIWTWREYGEIDYRAIALLDRLIEELPESAAVLRAHVQATAAGELYYWPERAGRAADLAEQACATMRARGGAADLARALELRRLASERPALLADRLATSADLVSLAESRYDESGLGRALIFRGRNRFELGDFASGNSDYERAGRIARRLEVVPVLVVLAWWDAAKLIAAARYAEAEAALARAAELHGRTTMVGANDLPLLLRASMDIARGTLANSAAQLAALAKASGIAVLADLAELAAQEAGTRHPGAAGVEPAPDYLWLAHQAIRTLILAPRGDCSATRELESALAPYSGRIVIGGTGICILGTVDHYLGLLAASRGDIETAIRRFGAALELARGCGLAAFASATENAIAQLHA